MEGKGGSPDRPAKEPSQLSVRGYTFNLPGRCSVCHTDCADEDSLYTHLNSFDHCANAEAWVLEHQHFAEGTGESVDPGVSICRRERNSRFRARRKIQRRAQNATHRPRSQSSGEPVEHKQRMDQQRTRQRPGTGELSRWGQASCAQTREQQSKIRTRQKPRSLRYTGWRTRRVSPMQRQIRAKQSSRWALTN